MKCKHVHFGLAIYINALKHIPTYIYIYIYILCTYIYIYIFYIYIYNIYCILNKYAVLFCYRFILLLSLFYTDHLDLLFFLIVII